MRTLFLPTQRSDIEDSVDFVLISGDAYVDHPSFGTAIIGRVLEKEGYRVAVLAQPDWHSVRDFRRFGRPRLAFLVTAGNIDSMVNHYTAAKRKRSEDAYSPGGQAGLRPDRATLVYCSRAREAYAGVPIVIGGVEASLRRFAHYDYWSDTVRRSILVDSGADIMVYGMGERPIVAVASALARGEAPDGIPGTCVLKHGAQAQAMEEDARVVRLPSFQAVSEDKRAYAQAFAQIEREQDAVRGRTLVQPHDQPSGKQLLVQYPPTPPLSQRELDAVFALPFQRSWHPDYDAAGGVPAIEEVQFGIQATRGCFGACSFCALTSHQGRTVQARSHASCVQEARMIAHMPGFKGYIHDVGGPTANFRAPSCKGQLQRGVCANKQCLYPKPCAQLEVDHAEFLALLRKLRAVEGVKKVFIRSGLRYDYLLEDKSDAFLRELCEHHISGQLKIAPEHVSPRVLRAMGKPGKEVFERFVERYEQANRQAGKKQYIVPYFMSSHPGSDLHAAIELAEYMREARIRPEQVQDFYPTPGTRSTCMFYTGLDPFTLKPVHVPRDPEEKAMQRALLQYSRPQNFPLVRKALRVAGREELIGYGPKCLVPPERFEGRAQGAEGHAPARQKKPQARPQARANGKAQCERTNARAGERPPKHGNRTEPKRGDRGAPQREAARSATLRRKKRGK